MPLQLRRRFEKENSMKQFCVTMMPLVLFTGCCGECTSKNNAIQESSQSMNQSTRQTTPSGLQYEIIQEGTGATPQKGQRVTVHYTGWLDNKGELGKKFDSSVDRGQPFMFVIGRGQVIRGWDEGVLTMRVGEKRRLIIPAALGYGPSGIGGVIPPNATLIFDVELLGVA